MKSGKRSLDDSTEDSSKKLRSTGDDDLTFSPLSVDTDDNNDLKSKRRSVACKPCHLLKVKCVPVNPDESFGICIRCEKGKKHCEFDLSNTRKRKLPTTIPVKTQMKGLKLELEKLKKDLEDKKEIIKYQNGLLQKKNDSNSYQNSVTPSTPSTLDPESRTTDHEESKLSKFEKEMSFLRVLNETTSLLTSSNVLSVAEKRVGLSSQKLDFIYHDMITNMGLSDEQCKRMIHVFLTKVYSRFPFVALPDNLNLDFLRQNEPLLLTLICYIATIADPEPSDISLDMQLHLESLISQTLAMDVLVIGSKTIQLLKSILLYCIWYIPPELFHHRRYHMYIMICASLINDLGLTERSFFFYSKETVTTTTNHYGPDSDPTPDPDSSSNKTQSVETQSINLVVYFMIISISLILRRRIPVRWNEYLNKACVDLENTNERRYTLISFYARLNHMLERIHYTVHSANEIIGILELSGTRYRHMLHDFQTQLSVIKQQIKIKTKDNESDYHSLMAYTYSVQAYMYEPTIYSVAIESPETLNFLKDENNFNFFSNIVSLTTESCTLAMKYYLKLKLDEIAVNPMVLSARVLYTSGLLLRLRYLTLTSPHILRANSVTDSSMSVVKDLSVRIYQAANRYPKNHFLGKMKLVLSLYTHTCLTQWLTAYNNAKAEGGDNDHNIPNDISGHAVSPSNTSIFPPPHLPLPSTTTPYIPNYIPNNSGLVPDIHTATGSNNEGRIPPVFTNDVTQDSRNGPPSFSSLLNDQSSHLQRQSPQKSHQHSNSSNFQTPLGPLMNGQPLHNNHNDPNLQQQQFYALNDEFWNDLFTGSDRNIIDYDMSTFMSDPSLGLM